MKHLFVALLVLCPAIAFAQPYPVGSGVVETAEKVKVSGGCGSIKIKGENTLTVNGDGTFEVDSPSGIYTGILEARDDKGLKWDLVLDQTSFGIYVDYLEAVGTDLCETPATITVVNRLRIKAKFKKDLTSVKLKLKGKVFGYTAFGEGTGKHAIKAKGNYAPPE